MISEMAEFKSEIVSKVTLKPSSPTPTHLRDFKLSLLDQLSHSNYLPIVLFFSTSDITKTSSLHDDHDFFKMSQQLKTSLSEVLTLYYPFCGRIKGSKNNVYVDCNDEGILYLEARIPSKFSEFLKNNKNSPTPDEIKEFLPLDPNNPRHENDDDEYPPTMAVQVSEFSCGSIAIGACISHRICDGRTAVSFLQAWSQRAMGHDGEVASPPPLPPNMEASFLFPPKEIEIIDIANDMISEETLTTKRFLFSGNSLCKLREEILRGCNFKPTRVESLTALIWKSAIEAAEAVDTTHQSSAMLLQHAVNIRSRTVPPLPENSIGNLWQFAVSPLFEFDEPTEVGLQDLAEIVRKTIRKIDSNYVSKLQGDAQGLDEILKSMEEVLLLVKKKGVACYNFTSWANFGLYEANFGWGKPTWACPIAAPTIKNLFIFLPTRSGEGIEAWVTLNELHMLLFENNPLLLQFASFDLIN